MSMFVPFSDDANADGDEGDRFPMKDAGKPNRRLLVVPPPRGRVVSSGASIFVRRAGKTDLAADNDAGGVLASTKEIFVIVHDRTDSRSVQWKTDFRHADGSCCWRREDC